MKFQIDHDLHIHSGGSMCSGDPNQTPERILQYAADEGFTAVALTDHFWDETVPMPKGGWGPDFYTSQNWPHICKQLPLPSHDNIRFLFGAEVDMTLDGSVGVSPERLAQMDILLISLSHFHMTDFTISAADAAMRAVGDTLNGGIDTVYVKLDREVSSTEIGELVMDKLKAMNDIAYVRFASVYRQFKDINTFMDELAKLLGEK